MASVTDLTAATITLSPGYKIRQFLVLRDQPGTEFDIVNDISMESIYDTSNIGTPAKLRVYLSQSSISPCPYGSNSDPIPHM